MSTFLVHIHTGVDDEKSTTKAALGLLIAKTAIEQGHRVNLFLAGDGVEVLDGKNCDKEGKGTGRIGAHLETWKAAGEEGPTMYVSKKSAMARGYDETLIEDFNATFALPATLVELAAEADTVLCY